MELKKERKENGHSGVKVSDTTSDFLLLWHCIVQRFWVVLHDTVKKNGMRITSFRGADHTQPPAGHQVIEFWVDLG